MLFATLFQQFSLTIPTMCGALPIQVLQQSYCLGERGNFNDQNNLFDEYE